MPGPNHKSHMNSPILPGENHAYPEADWPTREKIIERHTNFGLGLMWFLQNDESVPEAKRAGVPRSGACRRTSSPTTTTSPTRCMCARRGASSAATSSPSTTTRSRPASPARRSSPTASPSPTGTWTRTPARPTRRPGFHYDGKLILTEESRPAQIPYRALLPQGVDNLLVPVCLSATHVAWGAVRLEPVWMQTGEAAGLAAALALKNKTTPAQLDPDLLVPHACRAQVLVSFFNDVNVASDEPWIPAAQYFGTKGFFHDYNVRPGDALKLATGKLWVEALAKVRQGQLDPNALASAIAKAEQTEATMTDAEFTTLLPTSAKTARLKASGPITGRQRCSGCGSWWS